MESYPLLAGMYTHVHVAMVILGGLFIAKLEDLSYPNKASDGRSSGKERWNKATKKAMNKSTSTSKSRKQPRERDSSKASSRVK